MVHSVYSPMCVLLRYFLAYALGQGKVPLNSPFFGTSLSPLYGGVRAQIKGKETFCMPCLALQVESKDLTAEAL